MDKEWRWYIVANKQGNGDQVFNTRVGAEGWARVWGGEVIRVKAVEKQTQLEKKHE